MSQIDTLFQQGNFRIVFQPIFQIVSGAFRQHAIEALGRGPAGTHFEHAGVLFDYVRFKRAEIATDRLCIEASIRAAESVPNLPLLSINVHAVTLERDLDFAQFIYDTAVQSAVDPRRLIIEVVEQSRSWIPEKFSRGIASLREAGVAVALDDVGSGNCNFRMILDTRPDYLKVDAYLIQGCAKDVHRRRMLRSIAQLACDFGARVVAEGIELPEDLEVVVDLGITLLQGFLLARPSPHPIQQSAYVLPAALSATGAADTEESHVA